MEVDRSSPTPPYEQIANDIAGKIRSGEYPPGARLPSLADIVQEAGVAKVTAVRALKALREEGYAVSRPGWGTFAASRDSWPEH